MSVTICHQSLLSLLLRDRSPEAGEDLAQREARVPVELGRLPPRHGGGKRGVGASSNHQTDPISLFSLTFAFALLTLFHI